MFGVFGLLPPCMNIVAAALAPALRAGLLCTAQAGPVCVLAAGLLQPLGALLQSEVRALQSPVLQDCAVSLTHQRCEQRKNTFRVRKPLLSWHLKNWKCACFTTHVYCIFMAGREKYFLELFSSDCNRVFCDDSWGGVDTPVPQCAKAAEAARGLRPVGSAGALGRGRPSRGSWAGGALARAP